MDDVQVVAVAVALLVGVGEPARHPGDDEGGQVDGHLAVELAVLLEELLDVVAPHVLHDHEVLAADLPEVVGLDDVRVDQVRHEPGLPDEVLLELGDGGVLLADQLHGDRLPELAGPQLVRLVHDSHAALGDGPDHLVVDLVEDLFDRGHRSEMETPGLGPCK